MSKRKWIYFWALTAILLPSVIWAIKYCDIQIWSILPNNIAKFFIKPENADMLIYNLSVGYIVSYIFYLLVNFIPDLINEKEKEKELLSLRCAAQREVQLFTTRLILFWFSLAKTASSKGTVNISDVKSISDFFNREFIKQISIGVDFSDDSGTSTYNLNEIDWYTRILSTLKELSDRGNVILTRYKDSIPTEVFYNLFYIINESSMVAYLSSSVVIVTSANGKKGCLSQCMNFMNGTGGEDIDKSCEIIINLYNWVNMEYSYLNNHIEKNSARIHKINFNSYLK